jgi:hypothetical protein
MSHREFWKARPCIYFALLIILMRAPILVASVADEKQAPLGAEARRPVTMADAIRMTKVHDIFGRVAQFSPDGRKFVVVLKKGNLEQNTNEYSLLLWSTDQVFHLSPPELLLSMSSSSNREAIQDVTWMKDNITLAFLGEHPGGVRQLYTLDIRTRILKQVTSHPTNLVAYSLSARQDHLAYVAEGPVESLLDATVRREGVVVSTQWIHGLIAAKKDDSDLGNNQLFVLDATGARRMRISGRISKWGQFAMSPDGKYILAEVHVESIPESWKNYSDPYLHEFVQKNLARGQVSFLTKYFLIDTDTGEGRTLLDTPIDRSTSVAWSPDSRSVIIAGVYLPLDNTEGDERNERESDTFVVEVKIPGYEIVRVADEDKVSHHLSQHSSRMTDWSAKTGLIAYALHDQVAATDLKLFFQKHGERWEQVRELVSEQTQPEIIVDQGINNPPKIVAVNSRTHEKAALLDLNPQFTHLEFARVEEMTWKGSDGHEVSGGLYYPLNYVKGARYPLVIQTHGWNPNEFWIDGPYTTAFAAQALAGKDIIVLQANEIWGGPDFDTPQEVKREVSTFEGAIDGLDKKGLIDRNRVGIIGFSRTGTFVAFALTHSKYKFAAASVADGSDFGDFDFMLAANTSPEAVETVEKFYGGLPFGNALKSWIDLSPQFSLERVQTPLRIVATNPEMLLGQWGWFTSLLSLDKPVEMVYLPEGTHVLEKPWERMVSQQGNVDWFCFWLKGEEDRDPAKAEQYARWRELRKLQEQRKTLDGDHSKIN